VSFFFQNSLEIKMVMSLLPAPPTTPSKDEFSWIHKKLLVNHQTRIYNDYFYNNHKYSNLVPCELWFQKYFFLRTNNHNYKWVSSFFVSSDPAVDFTMKLIQGPTTTVKTTSKLKKLWMTHYIDDGFSEKPFFHIYNHFPYSLVLDKIFNFFMILQSMYN
jgi:hypothetical protein